MRGGPALLRAQVMAEAIVNAAQERFSGMAPEQVPKSSQGYIRAAVSHLSKREVRETGRVHPGGAAARAQATLAHSLDGDETDVERNVGRVMKSRGMHG